MLLLTCLRDIRNDGAYVWKHVFKDVHGGTVKTCTLTFVMQHGVLAQTFIMTR